MAVTARTNPGSAVTTASRRLRWLGLSGWLCLTLYGTLFPFTGWRPASAHAWFLDPLAHSIVSSPDMLANVLLYMPLGFIVALHRRWHSIFLAVAIAAAISLSLETAQAFLPGRYSSLLDIATNVFGAGLGAAMALLVAWPMHMLDRSVLTQLQHDRVAWLGLTALAVWVCAQLLPFVPSLDVANLKAGLRPLWQAWQGSQPVSLWRGAVYATATAALTVTGISALRARYWNGMVAAALLAVLPLKVLVIGRQLSPEALVGTLAGVALGLALQTCGYRRALGSAVLCIVVYIAAEALQPGAAGTAMHAFNWLPLQAQMSQPVNGLANLADAIWPPLTLGCLCCRLHMRSLWPLLPAVALLLFGVEWAQCWIPGRYPDITSVLAGTLAWTVAAAYVGRQHPQRHENTEVI